MQDRAHDLADRAAGRQQQAEPEPAETQRREPVWRGDSGPMTADESRQLADAADLAHRRGR